MFRILIPNYYNFQSVVENIFDFKRVYCNIFPKEGVKFLTAQYFTVHISCI